jgi:hypothetical protein
LVSKTTLTFIGLGLVSFAGNKKNIRQAINTMKDVGFVRNSVETPRHKTAYLSARPSDAPLMVFIHRWPELSLVWRVSKTQETKLRKETSAFIATEFRQVLENTLLAIGVPADQFKLSVEESDVEDRDPQVLELGYHSALAPEAYIAERVLIEIGARLLREPS